MKKLFIFAFVLLTPLLWGKALDVNNSLLTLILNVFSVKKGVISNDVKRLPPLNLTNR